MLTGEAVIMRPTAHLARPVGAAGRTIERREARDDENMPTIGLYWTELRIFL
jgi:hypothetical protein